MKRILTLLFALTCLSSTAQKETVSIDSAASKAKMIAKSDTAHRMSELDFYKEMFEQAKGNADRTHDEIQSFYGINVTIILSIVAIILAIQLFNTKDELERQRNWTKEEIQKSAKTLQEQIDASNHAQEEMIKTHSTDLKRITKIVQQLETQITTEIDNNQRLYIRLISLMQQKRQIPSFNEILTLIDALDQDVGTGQPKEESMNKVSASIRMVGIVPKSIHERLNKIVEQDPGLAMTANGSVFYYLVRDIGIYETDTAGKIKIIKAVNININLY